MRQPTLRAALILVLLALLGGACRNPTARGRPDIASAPQASPRAMTPVTIEVFGTPGVQFEGAYGELGDTKPVSGTVPTRLTFRSGVGFTVALQKRATQGELGIKVIVDGRTITQSSTKKVHGLVTYTQRSSVK